MEACCSKLWEKTLEGLRGAAGRGEALDLHAGFPCVVFVYKRIRYCTLVLLLASLILPNTSTSGSDLPLRNNIPVQNNWQSPCGQIKNNALNYSSGKYALFYLFLFSKASSLLPDGVGSILNTQKDPWGLPGVKAEVKTSGALVLSWTEFGKWRDCERRAHAGSFWPGSCFVV